MGMYGDCEPAEVEKVAQAVAKLFLSIDDIKQLAADCGTYFPADFGSIRPSKVQREYVAAQEAKLGK